MLLKTKGVKFGQCGPIFPSTFPALRQQQTVLHNSSVRLKNAVQASAPQQEPRASSRPREGAEEPAG